MSDPMSDLRKALDRIEKLEAERDELLDALRGCVEEISHLGQRLAQRLDLLTGRRPTDDRAYQLSLW